MHIKKINILNFYATWSVVLSIFSDVHASLQANPLKKYIVDFSFFFFYNGGKNKSHPQSTI